MILIPVKTYVTTLATGIVPITRSHTVFISPDFSYNGSDLYVYTLHTRYTPHHAPRAQHVEFYFNEPTFKDLHCRLCHHEHARYHSRPSKCHDRL